MAHATLRRVTQDDAAAGEPRAADGRIPGRRGRATRRRLLDTTLALLETTPYRELRVVDIAREAGTSPATFYQYFADVEAAVLVLAAELAEAGADELSGLVTGADWRVDPEGAARAVTDGHLDFWTRHRSLIGVIDLAALAGDSRFRDLRTWLLSGVSRAFADEVRAAQTARPAQPAADELAVAAVLTSMLAHVAAHHDGIVEWGASEEGLRSTMAELIVAGLGGSR